MAQTQLTFHDGNTATVNHSYGTVKRRLGDQLTKVIDGAEGLPEAPMTHDTFAEFLTDEGRLGINANYVVAFFQLPKDST